jgi:pyridoxamine 5'-phosphate oxidase
LTFPTQSENPIEVFQQWFDEAKATGINHPDAVNLATASADGVPSSRMVLLKSVDEKGFVVFTNYGSQKAKELDSNPHAALCFFWRGLEKQVRVVGSVQRVSNEESDAYFATRAKQSQLGAWASKQSQPLPSKKKLIADVAKLGLKHNIGEVPRPEFWGGYRIVPTSIEFWAQGGFRIHDRIRFDKTDTGWGTTRLYP